MSLLRIAVAAALLGGCAARRAPAPGAQGPRHAQVPLYRAGADGPRIYVEADLGDGVPRLFLVDTGASLSVLQQEVADSLGLELQARNARVVGMGGASRFSSAQVDSLRLGPFSLFDVDFAVGVSGLPTRAGLAPVAGILGTNVWQQFHLVLDYPAHRMELWRPEHAPEVEGLGPMYFNGEHVRVEAVLEVDAGEGLDQPLSQPVWLDVDTGASGVIINGPVPGDLALAATEGLEPVFGIGGGDDLPASDFLRRTRRVSIQRIRLGEVVVEEPIEARWFNYDQSSMPFGPAGLPGLLGHHVLDDYRVVLDFQRRAFGLLPTAGPGQPHDVHAWALSHLKRPRTPDEARRRAELLLAEGRKDDAVDVLSRWHADHPEHAGVAVLLARLERNLGRWDAALHTLSELPPEALLDQGELIAAVNAWWLAGQPVRGRALADQAVRGHPDRPRAWVALSDALRFSGDYGGARRALTEANRLSEHPDGNLLRRAWLAALEGDRFGAITHARRLMELFPSGGLAPWFYGHQVGDADTRSLLEADVDHARRRLHPDHGALDFFAGALLRAGDGEAARDLGERGRERDCTQAPTAPARDNCEAWYRALSGHDLDAAEAAIARAVAAEPRRADFQDTLAMVLEATGDLAGAREAAWAAARTEPDNLYFLWQAARLDAAARADGS